MGGSIKGEWAFITGATSGIGKACAIKFAQLGVHLILTGRRQERLQTLAEELSSQYGVQVISTSLDVRKRDQVAKVCSELKQEIDIVINNAGLALAIDKVQEANIENWEIMIDTNLKGLLYVTRALLPTLIKRNKGHIINIGSIAGHECYPGGNVYCATKFAVKALSRSLRLDVSGTALRISEVDPGAVETEFSEVRLKDKERAKELYQGFTPLTPEDVADAVIYCATRAPHVNIAEMLILPQAQASITTLYRQS